MRKGHCRVCGTWISQRRGLRHGYCVNCEMYRKKCVVCRKYLHGTTIDAGFDTCPPHRPKYEPYKPGPVGVDDYMNDADKASGRSALERYERKYYRR